VVVPKKLVIKLSTSDFVRAGIGQRSGSLTAGIWSS
jgi:hypothetical protein